MKKALISCISFLIYTTLSGQIQGYSSPDFWKKYTEALAFDIKLEPLSIKGEIFRCRFWAKGQVIDIWKDNSGQVRGEIVNYAKQYDEMNLGKRTFYNGRLPVDPAIASEISRIILSTGITSLPSEEAISGWDKNAGGFTWIFEYADSGNYRFNCYLSPEKQPSLKEAQTVQTFLDNIEHLLKLEKKYKAFAASIPFMCYTRGTTEVICRKK